MSIPNPKFSVGDEVIHIARGTEHVITDAGWVQRGLNDFQEEPYTGWAYGISDLESGLFGPHGRMAEQFLRPKPKQDDSEAFERFMEKIDLNIKLPIAQPVAEEVT